MTRGTKIALAIVVVLMGVCLCTAVGWAMLSSFVGKQIGQAVVTDPQKAAEMGRGIAGYNVPAGYEQGGFGFLGYQMVVLSQTNRPDLPVFMFMQIPTGSGASQADLEKQFMSMAQQQTTMGSTQLSPVGIATYTIDGKEVHLTVHEGNNNAGQSIRMMLGAFEGNSGPAMVMVVGSLDSWDQRLVDSFFSSMR